MKMNVNEQTKTIRNYEKAFRYKDGENIVQNIETLLFAVLMLAMIVIYFLMLFEQITLYKTAILAGGFLFGYILFLSIYKSFETRLATICRDFLNKKNLQINNQYTKLILQAEYLYDSKEKFRYITLKLLEHMSTPYFNQAMKEDIMKLDNCIAMLIDEDLKNNPKELSGACYDMIYNETKQLAEKFVSFKNQYETQQELLRKQHTEHLVEKLTKYKSDLGKQDKKHQ